MNIKDDGCEQHPAESHTVELPCITAITSIALGADAERDGIQRELLEIDKRALAALKDQQKPETWRDRPPLL